MITERVKNILHRLKAISDLSIRHKDIFLELA